MATTKYSSTLILMMITPSVLLFLALFSLTSLADVSNVLLTGETLATDGQLSFHDATFVIQDDCNLVLYNKGSGFQSNTHGQGVNCTLTLNEYGQFVIKSATSISSVWTTGLGSNAQPGKYAAVLGPDGQVTVYGPAVWSTPPTPQFRSNVSTPSVSVPNVDGADVPTVISNVLFSSQILDGNSELTTRDYTLVMQEDCNLVLTKAGYGALWESGTSGKGQHCFARLGHQGLLSVLDDCYATVWDSQSVGSDGDYVLILQIDGQAVIYGSAVWSTAIIPVD